ncbi:structural protein [Vibrio anguillarum]|uniref:structural protein n=3 Tax=Vibrio anguillarum TaxID=55601 RepID=UPI001F3D6F61|nr:structural protein [Vibrio anguillarum]
MNQKHWLLMAAITAAVLLSIKGSSIVTRGIRNNNPANIEDNGTPWRGRMGNDGRFIIFDSPVNGIRALARILNTYKVKHGLNTIEGIINRFAPPVENDTNSYIAHAEKVVGVPRNMPLTPDKYPSLIKVIIKHENGVQPYSDEVINAGIAAA